MKCVIKIERGCYVLLQKYVMLFGCVNIRHNAWAKFCIKRGNPVGVSLYLWHYFWYINIGIPPEE